MEIKNSKFEKSKITENLNNFFTPSQSITLNGGGGGSLSDVKALPNPNERYYQQKLNSQRENLIKESNKDSNNMNDLLSMINNAKISNNIPQNHQKNNSIKATVSPNKMNTNSNKNLTNLASLR